MYSTATPARARTATPPTTLPAMIGTLFVLPGVAGEVERGDPDGGVGVGVGVMGDEPGLAVDDAEVVADVASVLETRTR